MYTKFKRYRWMIILQLLVLQLLGCFYVVLKCQLLLITKRIVQDREDSG